MNAPHFHAGWGAAEALRRFIPLVDLIELSGRGVCVRFHIEPRADRVEHFLGK